MRARSRSTTSRTATLCTRPADAAWPRPNTRHSTGDVSQPTRRSRMRRPSCASTSFMSSSRGLSSASRIACGVISWNTMRFTGTRGFNTSSTCQPMASPSRSSSVATMSSSAFFNACFNSETTFFLLLVHDVHDVEVVVGVDAREPAVRLLLGVGHLVLAARAGRGCARRSPSRCSRCRDSPRWSSPSQVTRR